MSAEQGDVERLTGKPFVAWPTQYDAVVSVGLGTNNKDQLVGHLMGLMQMDEKLVQLQGGAQGPLLTLDNIFAKLKDLQQAMGIKSADYYTDPAQQAQGPALPEQESEQRDPAIVREQIRGKTAENVAHIRGEYALAGKRPTLVPDRAGIYDPMMENLHGQA